MQKLKNLLNHERYQCIGILIVVAVIVWSYGCPSRVPSISTPGQKITRAELDAEVQTFVAYAEVRYKQLDQQDAFKKSVFDAVLPIAQTGTFNIAGLVAIAAGVFGTGAIIDNARKRKVIKSNLTEYVASTKREKLDQP